MKKIEELLFILAAVAIAFVLGITLGSKATQNQAIQHGVASYQCNPKTGAITFQWKDNQ